MQFLTALLLSVVLWWPGTGVEQRDWEPLPPPFCRGLSEIDCQLLIDSQELLRHVSSFQMSATMQASVTGIPAIASQDAVDEELALAMQIDASMHIEPELNERMHQLIQATQLEGSDEALSDVYKELAEVVVEFYETAAMDIRSQITLPQVLISLAEQEAGAPLPQAFTVEMRILDGYAYVNMDSLAESFPDLRESLEQEGLTGWIGLDMAGQLRNDLLRSTPSMDESLQAGMLLGRLTGDDAVRQLIEPHVTVRRLDDALHNGERVAVFRTSFDFARFAARPEFSRLLRLLIDSAGEISGETIDQQQVGMTLLGLQMLANLLARSSQFEMVRAIGLDVPYLHQQVLSVRLDFSGLLAFLALSGVELPVELRGAKPIFILELDYHFSNFDAAPPVEKPAGAKIIPLELPDQETINLIS